MFGSFCFRWRFIFEHKICLVLQAEVMIFVAFKNSTSALHKLAPGWFELESLCVFTLSLAWIQCVLVCSEACLQKACFFQAIDRDTNVALFRSRGGSPVWHRFV